MPTLDKEIVKEKYNTLASESSSVIDKFNSIEITNTVGEISKRAHLDTNKEQQLYKLIGYIILGLIHPEDLDEDITEDLKIDPRLAKELTQKIKIKVLAPIANDLNEAHGFHLTPTDPVEKLKVEKELSDNNTPEPKPSPRTEAPKEQETPQEVETVPVNRAETQKEEQPTNTPVVIHQHETGRENDGQSGYPGGLVRPSFYKPPSNTLDESDTPQARLEIGQQSPSIQPITKVGKEHARVVHYEIPKTPQNPFTKPMQEKKEDSNEKENKEVPDSNVVNLKDLPK